MATKKKVASKTKKTASKAKTKSPKKVTRSVEKYPASFLKQQQRKLLSLRDELMDSMGELAAENLRKRGDSDGATAFGMHQADAGSDAYDRDFALNLLAQEQDALEEINQALERIDKKTYGVCEDSGKLIPVPRLEAIPFARYTVECQEAREKESRQTTVRRNAVEYFES